LQKKLVLAIDTSLDFLKFVQTVATSGGHHVHIANNAPDFMTLYGKVNPDTVILEVVMPEVDGIELIKWLCGQDVRCRVIAVTADYLYLAKAAQSLAGPYPHLTVQTAVKPLTADQLLALIEDGASSDAAAPGCGPKKE